MMLPYGILLLGSILPWISAAVPQPRSRVLPRTKFMRPPTADELGGNFTAFGTADHPNWPYWCQTITDHSPTYDDAKWLADYLNGLGSHDCVVQRNEGSTDVSYTQMNAHGSAKAGIYFTNLADTTSAYHAAFPCALVAEALYWVLEVCTVNGRVQGGTPMPNCWANANSIQYTGDSAPSGDNGAGVEFAPYP